MTYGLIRGVWNNDSVSGGLIRGVRNNDRVCIVV
jgi:hypothetical protein